MDVPGACRWIGDSEKAGRPTVRARARALGFARMPHGDFVTKLRQIEEQANAAIAELPAGMLKTRIQHIVVLAKTLRGRLEFGALTVVRGDPDATVPGDSTPL
jgi:hypothetical protein